MKSGTLRTVAAVSAVVCLTFSAAAAPAGGQTPDDAPWYDRSAPSRLAYEPLCSEWAAGLGAASQAAEEGQNLDFQVTVENWRGYVDFTVLPETAGESDYRLVNSRLWFDALDSPQTRAVRVEASADEDMAEDRETFTLEAVLDGPPDLRAEARGTIVDPDTDGPEGLLPETPDAVFVRQSRGLSSALARECLKPRG